MIYLSTIIYYVGQSYSNLFSIYDIVYIINYSVVRLF